MAQRTVRAYPPDATCIVDGCDARPASRWMCGLHRNRARGKNVVPLDAPRQRYDGDRAGAIAARTIRSATGCDEWTGSRNEWGYGSMRSGHRSLLAHRVAWELAHGPIPVGLHVLHHCDNPPCLRTEPDDRYPDGHLFLGTQMVNVADMDAKGRRHNAQGGAHGMAKLTEADIPAIRRRVAEGEPVSAVARSFGVGHVAVRRIVNGVSWTHVPAHVTP